MRRGGAIWGRSYDGSVLSHLGRGPTKRLTLALLGVAWAAAALVLLMASAAGMVLDRPFGDFSWDATTVLEGPAYIGFVSNVGAVAWALGCGACLVGALAIDGRARLPLACGGLLTAILLADDLFLIHEAYIERVGLPMVAEPIIYAGLGIAYFVTFGDFLRRHGIWLLPLAGALLAVSAGIDAAFEENAPFVVEDGTKLFGIVTWTSFFVSATVAELRSLGSAPPRADT